MAAENQSSSSRSLHATHAGASAEFSLPELIRLRRKAQAADYELARAKHFLRPKMDRLEKENAKLKKALSYAESKLRDTARDLRSAERRIVGAERRLAQSQQRIQQLRDRPSYRWAWPLRMIEKALGLKPSEATSSKPTSTPSETPLQLQSLPEKKPATSYIQEEQVLVLDDSGNDSETSLSQIERDVRQTRIRLRNLGFTQRGENVLQTWAADPNDPLRRALAAWELACYYLDEAPENKIPLAHSLLEEVERSEIADRLGLKLVIMRAEALSRSGRTDEAKALLANAATQGSRPSADLCLALASMETTPELRLVRLNEALSAADLPAVGLSGETDRSPYDRLIATDRNTPSDFQLPLVTVIMPVFNGGANIETAIRSILNQTYRNLEVIVVDDCSTDETVAIVTRLAQTEPRLKLLRNDTNSGPYVARNRALREARGEFVTCHDADDWSHPRKIEVQALHLIKHPAVLANTSRQARVTADLTPTRRGNPGFYIQMNISSLMFRTGPALERIGYWDSVRFAGDSEYLRRMKTRFGKNSVVELATGPLSFQRQSSTSLTASQHFGYSGFKMGARFAYAEAGARFHKTASDLYVDFPLRERPFPAPMPMRLSPPSSDTARHFDIILVSDFRLPGGTNMSNAEELKIHRELGLTTGLVQLGLYHLEPNRWLNSKIAAHIDGNQCDLLVVGERATCDLLILRQPWALEDWQDYVPAIQAREIRVIVNQPPKRDYAAGSECVYHLQRCAEHLLRYFGRVGTWHPIGPLVRDALTRHHANELEGIPLSPDDWPNVISVAEWRRQHRPPPSSKIRICRHSRDQYVKWPVSRDDLLAAYPDSDRFEIHVLGGAETPQEVLGTPLPSNWKVIPFGKQEPKQFLAEHDVFVYFTHPDWVEAFGRVIVEAMAVGLPVILPEVYKPLFRESALYATPSEVVAKVDALMADPAAYDRQVAASLAYVEANFGHSKHRNRIGKILGKTF